MLLHQIGSKLTTRLVEFCRNRASLGKTAAPSHAPAERGAAHFIFIALAGGFLLASNLPTGASAAQSKPLRLATTTSTENSGLLNYLLPEFTRDRGYTVHVIAVGTGKALRMGRDGDADIVLVHARAAEDQFVADGHGVNRRDVMYNDFVIVGPASDPAGIGKSRAVDDAFRRIAGAKHIFISRGDDSGTHKRELSLWKLAGVKPGDGWYREAGQGMGKVLQIASELDAYTMTDRGTWLAMKNKLPLKLLFENDPPLHNPYGVIAVNPARHPHTDIAGANAFIDWITSPKAQRMINGFRINGDRLFIPLAVKIDNIAVKEGTTQ